MVKVLIIILSWNTRDLLEKCLKSIPFSAEIIVVDNGSTDGSLQLINSLKWPNLKVIANKTNLGFTKGNNQGIKLALRQAQCDLIMLLNSDTIVQKGAIEKLVNFYNHQKDKNLALSPLLLNPNGTIQKEYYMRFPNLWQIFFYHHPVLRPLVMKTPLRQLVVSLLPSHLRVDQLPGAALIAPKEVWQRVGLLDEDYQFLYEDVDWCWRAKKLGLKLFVVPEAKITHLGGASWKQKLKANSFEFYCQFFSSMLLFIKKNYGERQLKIFRMALVINFLLQFKFKLAKYFINLGTQIKQEKLWR